MKIKHNSHLLYFAKKTGIALCFIVPLMSTLRLTIAAPEFPRESKNPQKTQRQKPSGDSVPQSFKLVGPSESTVSGNISEGNPYLSVVHSPFVGKLVYTVMQSKEEPDSLLVLNKLRDNRKSYQREIYRLTNTNATSKGDADVLTSPVLSPDGRYVAFKLSKPWLLLNSYLIYVLDLQTGNLTQASDQRLSYPTISWSPDSRFISFVDNGNSQGEVFILGKEYIGPLTLFICEWRTGNTQKVVENDTIGRFSWSSSGELVYGALSVEDQERVIAYNANREQKPSPKDKNKDEFIVRPNLYSYSPGSKKTKLIVKDGYQPVPSPNNQLIAFYGSPDPINPIPLLRNWKTKSRGSALCVSKIDGSERFVLGIENQEYSSIQWLKDNRRLLTVHTSSYGIVAHGEVKEWDIESKKERLICTLKAENFKAIPSFPFAPPFQPLGISPDEEKLFVSVIELIGIEPDESRFTVRRTVKSIDIKTGLVADVTQTLNDTGLDWRFG